MKKQTKFNMVESSLKSCKDNSITECLSPFAQELLDQFISNEKAVQIRLLEGDGKTVTVPIYPKKKVGDLTFTPKGLQKYELLSPLGKKILFFCFNNLIGGSSITNINAHSFRSIYDVSTNAFYASRRKLVEENIIAPTVHKDFYYMNFALINNGNAVNVVKKIKTETSEYISIDTHLLSIMDLIKKSKLKDLEKISEIIKTTINNKK